MAAQQRRHDGTVAAKGRRRKRAAHRGCAPFIDGEGESGAAARLWAARWQRQSHGHGWRRCSDRETDGWAPRGFVFS
jgi:hypothetical protein